MALTALANAAFQKILPEKQGRPEVEEAMLRKAIEFPAYGQTRASNELRKAGTLVSGGGSAAFGCVMAWGEDRVGRLNQRDAKGATLIA